jgi:hypothetical protein
MKPLWKRRNFQHLANINIPLYILPDTIPETVPDTVPPRSRSRVDQRNSDIIKKIAFRTRC